MDIIRLSGVSKIYRLKGGESVALRDVSLEIGAGDFVAVRGESGSGKSTLLQIMSGLDIPSSGEVIVGGQDMSRMRDRELSGFRNRMFGFVFQSFYLHPLLTLRQNVELPAMFADVSEGERLGRTNELVRFLGLEELIDRLPTAMSGGQMQRAAILRAIYNHPKIVFADEPTGNLDLKSAMQVLELLKRVHAEFGITVVMATHDDNMSAAARRVINLDHGEMV